MVGRRASGSYVAKTALRARDRAVTVDPVIEPAPDAAAPGFEGLYTEAFPEMVRLAFLLTGSLDTATDLVQESFVKLHRAWDRAENPPAYLRRVVVNECASYHRRRYRHLRVQPLLVSGPVELEADEISDALAGLRERERAAIVLRYWNDCSEQEIADILGCRPGTVGSLIHRGLAHLRGVIEQ